MSGAYSKALAWESIPDRLKDKYAEHLGLYRWVSPGDLEYFARIVVYKVAHNLKNGHQMDEDADPLTYVDCGGCPPLV